MACSLEFGGDGFDHFRRQLVDALRVAGIVGHQAGELVAAQPGGERPLRQQSGNPAGAFLDDRVAGAVAQRIVELLEAVEVGDQHGDGFAARLALGNQQVGGCGQAAAIEEAGERVGFGEMPGQGFRCAAAPDRDRQLPVMPPAEQDQGDVEQQGADQHVAGLVAAAVQRLQGLRHGEAADADEHQDRGSRDRQGDRIAAALRRASCRAAQLRQSLLIDFGQTPSPCLVRRRLCPARRKFSVNLQGLSAFAATG